MSAWLESLAGRCRKAFNLPFQSEKRRLRLILFRLQILYVFLKLRNLFTEFRYYFWVFIHGLFFGYTLPRDGQSDAKPEVLSNAKKIDGPGALHDPVNPCQNPQKSASPNGGNTKSESSSAYGRKSGCQQLSREG